MKTMILSLSAIIFINFWTFGMGGCPDCSNGIQDCDETGVDCGGLYCLPCPTCPVCFDEVQNCSETGIDCGGPNCPACFPTPPCVNCFNGIQDGGETGVDCGGPDCESCIPNNYASNPSFECLDRCPGFWSTGVSDQLARAVPWYNPTTGTADFFHSCAKPDTVGAPDNWVGSQNPRSGNGYGGLFARAGAEWREYLQVPLVQALSAGTYDVSFYASLSDDCNITSDRLGAYLSVGSITSAAYTNLNVIPQITNPLGSFLTDKTNWVLISGTYVAAGGENYITIGNFYDDANTTTVAAAGGFRPWVYFYIDDLCITPAGSGACNALLPVNISLFKGNINKNGTISLNWTTQVEINNSHYEIEILL